MSEEVNFNHPISPWRAGRLIFFASLTLTTASAFAYAIDSEGAGGLLYGATSVMLIVAITIGPLARGAKPRRVWLIETAAGASLLIALLTQIGGGQIGPVRYVDIAYFAGYFLFLLWLTLLFRHVVGEGGRSSILDSSAAGVGVALALWSVALAPLVGGWQLPFGLVYAVYPTVDVVMLALAVHLAVRLEEFVPAVAWLVAAISIQLVVDTAHSLVRLMSPGADTAPVFSLFIFWLFCLAMAATHPSVVNLSRRPPGHRPRPSTRTVSLVMFLAVSPAVLSTAIPVTGAIDIGVRTILVALLLTLLIVRLRRTVDALSEAEADSHHRATHDQLTGLMNRAAVIETLDALLIRNRARLWKTAVLFVDCDDFKHVNDTWGHSAGDTLLKDIAKTLPRVLRPRDVLARHGGDEFVVLATVTSVDEAVALARRITDYFDAPLRILPGRVHAVTASIGIAVADSRDHVTTEDLLGMADVAMYEAKYRARGRSVLFGEDLEARTRTRAGVGDRLERAVGEDLFGLELQPVMGGPGYMRIVGWEALARWRDPELGNVPPDVFIPLAEQLGVIGDIGELVLRRACDELVRLDKAMPHEALGVFVNVSPAQLLEPGFAEMVRDVLRSTRLPRKRLRLELTETMLVDEGPVVDGVLRELREAGACIVLDDFGSGYASLATLLRLPLDCVKLDKSLVARLGVDDEAPAQIGAVIELIHSLGIESVIAEGVETREQEAALAELGCPMVQGWLYGRPASPESILPRVAAPTNATGTISMSPSV